MWGACAQSTVCSPLTQSARLCTTPLILWALPTFHPFRSCSPQITPVSPPSGYQWWWRWLQCRKDVAAKPHPPLSSAGTEGKEVALPKNTSPVFPHDPSSVPDCTFPSRLSISTQPVCETLRECDSLEQSVRSKTTLNKKIMMMAVGEQTLPPNWDELLLTWDVTLARISLRGCCRYTSWTLMGTTTGSRVEEWMFFLLTSVWILWQWVPKFKWRRQ